jgi:hypothetical protein
VKDPDKRSPITVGSERVPMSPAEKAAKVRRCARAMQYGRGVLELRRQGYTENEVKDAQQMLRMAGEGRQ